MHVSVSTHNGGVDDGSSSGKAHTSKQIFVLMVDHCMRKGGKHEYMTRSIVSVL